MSAEAATAWSDLVLSVGTLILALTVRPSRDSRCWPAFFGFLALAAAGGAAYHGLEGFRTLAFWSAVSAASAAGAFLFLAGCAGMASPIWSWAARRWPLMALAGAGIGWAVADQPFYVLSLVSGGCILIGAALLWTAPGTRARAWIYAGVAVSIAGLLLQRYSRFDGLLGPNALFHWFQLAGNTLFWLGARSTEPGSRSHAPPVGPDV